MAWQLLFSSDIGLLSLFVIVLVLGMAVWFSRFYNAKMRQDEQAASAADSADKGKP